MTRNRFELALLQAVGLITAILLVFIAIPALAQDAGTPAADIDIAAIAKLILGGVQAGNWGLAVCAALVGVVWLLRKLVPAHTVVGKVLATKWGGWALNFVASAAGALATALAAGATFSISMLLAVIVTSLAASGLWELMRDLGAKKVEAATAAGAAAGGAIDSKGAAVNLLKGGPQP